jgi:hypothetical protein
VSLKQFVGESREGDAEAFPWEPPPPAIKPGIKSFSSALSILLFFFNSLETGSSRQLMMLPNINLFEKPISKQLFAKKRAHCKFNSIEQPGELFD